MIKPDNELPATRGEKIFTIAIAAVFLLLMGMEIARDYEPKKLSALLFCTFWMLLVGVHELAHAIVARLVGWKVGRIVIGFGKTIKEFEFRSIPVELKMFPIEGFIRCAPMDMNNPRIKDALIYFAGPGVELLIFWVVLLFMGSDNLFTITNDYPRIVIQSLAFSALIGGVMNLIPHGVVTNQGEIPNDGLGILQCAFRTKKSYEARLEDGGRTSRNFDNRLN